MTFNGFIKRGVKWGNKLFLIIKGLTLSQDELDQYTQNNKYDFRLLEKQGNEFVDNNI